MFLLWKIECRHHWNHFINLSIIFFSLLGTCDSLAAKEKHKLHRSSFSPFYIPIKYMKDEWFMRIFYSSESSAVACMNFSLYHLVFRLFSIRTYNIKSINTFRVEQDKFTHKNIWKSVGESGSHKWIPSVWNDQHIIRVKIDTRRKIQSHFGIIKKYCLAMTLSLIQSDCCYFKIRWRFVVAFFCCCCYFCYSILDIYVYLLSVLSECLG